MNNDQIKAKASEALKNIHSSMWESEFKDAEFLNKAIELLPASELNGYFRDQAEHYFAKIDEDKALTFSENIFLRW